MQKSIDFREITSPNFNNSKRLTCKLISNDRFVSDVRLLHLILQSE